MAKTKPSNGDIWDRHKKSYKAFMKNVLKKKKTSKTKTNLKKKLVKCVASKVDKI